MTYPKMTHVIATHYIGRCKGGTGRTKTGIDVRHTIYSEGLRIIAVDPSVIPLGTVVTVVTPYGSFDAIAGDIGGAINGNRIDILVNNYDEAITLGKVEATVVWRK